MRVSRPEGNHPLVIILEFLDLGVPSRFDADVTFEEKQAVSFDGLLCHPVSH